MKTEGHAVVSHDAWIEARRALLAKEKDFTRQRDELGRARRALPWEKVEKPYAFETPAGRKTLAELFDGRSQLAVYHFMFAPEWEEGCPHCSFWADNFSGITVHLRHRDVNLVAVSRAPLAKIERFRKRMGWTFPWVSSAPSDFNYDLGVSFTPEDAAKGKAVYNYVPTKEQFSDREGASIFYKDAAGSVFHTYSCYARGIDLLNSAYNFLDLVPKGRDEDELEFVQEWVRHHDRYED
jgi:predicted dithiol-disulfide oxidoreductase (DUF899 family)